MHTLVKLKYLPIYSERNGRILKNSSNFFLSMNHVARKVFHDRIQTAVNASLSTLSRPPIQQHDHYTMHFAYYTSRSTRDMDIDNFALLEKYVVDVVAKWMGINDKRFIKTSTSYAGVADDEHLDLCICSTSAVAIDTVGIKLEKLSTLISTLGIDPTALEALKPQLIDLFV